MPSASSQDGKFSLFERVDNFRISLTLVLPCSHGEALTFEPLLLENREESPLRDYSIAAIATVTQVCCTYMYIAPTLPAHTPPTSS